MGCFQGGLELRVKLVRLQEFLRGKEVREAICLVRFGLSRGSLLLGSHASWRKEIHIRDL